MGGPPRTTEKTLQWQQHTARMLQERREQEWREQQNNTGQARETSTKMRDLHEIKERVIRRPLLMEQVDSLVRARRRALFRVRSTLEAAGVHDIDSHFQDEELGILECARAPEATDVTGV